MSKFLHAYADDDNSKDGAKGIAVPPVSSENNRVENAGYQHFLFFVNVFYPYPTPLLFKKKYS